MNTLRTVTCLVAILLAASEIARWWGQPRFMPMALDELLVAGAMLSAAVFTRHSERGWLAAAWGIYCGFVLSLLIPTVDHLTGGGPPKASAGFYTLILGAMLIVGMWALVRAITLTQAAPFRR